VVLAVVSAAVIAYDIYGRGRRQPVRLSEGVWILSGLWLGPLALALYNRVARPRSEHPEGREPHDTHGELGVGAAAAAGGLAGGAASLIGHVIGVPLVLALGLSILGVPMFAMIGVIAVLAIAMLWAFEYSVGRRAHMGSKTIGAALLVATVTVLAFDIGMGGWMLVLHYNAWMPPLTSVTFLFLMQIGIVLGFLTGYPAVALLLKRGVKVTA